MRVVAGNMLQEYRCVDGEEIRVVYAGGFGQPPVEACREINMTYWVERCQQETDTVEELEACKSDFISENGIII